LTICGGSRLTPRSRISRTSISRVPQAATMSGERLEVAVTFEPAKGYVATVPDLAEPITALSLAVCGEHP
jgi:hypothetical protein